MNRAMARASVRRPLMTRSATPAAHTSAVTATAMNIHSYQGTPSSVGPAAG